ncbi:MAG: hypothetical protein MN733_10220, partial [Nitrososphaera sp.]|nr:hypothetical protein [Nitrososphaera sp.]
LAPSRSRLSKPVILSTLISRSKGRGPGAARRPTNPDQPRRARRLGKAKAFHGVGCSAWLGIPSITTGKVKTQNHTHKTRRN